MTGVLQTGYIIPVAFCQVKLELAFFWSAVALHHVATAALHIRPRCEQMTREYPRFIFPKKLHCVPADVGNSCRGISVHANLKCFSLID